MNKFSRRYQVFKRWFRIWTVTGESPFRKTEELSAIECPSCGTKFDTPYCPQCGEKYHRKKKHTSGFFKGSFDSIPFLNDDAKRTFVHILLRPGYMMRDYINGKTSRYLAPMAALIIFYAFFALISSIMAPYGHKDPSYEIADIRDSVMTRMDSIRNASEDSEGQVRAAQKTISSTLSTVEIIDLFHLDEHPDLVDTKWKASLAAVQSSMKNGGISLFLSNLILLSIAIWWAFRKKYGITYPAAAAVTAYVLCQYCFFMLFAVIGTLGRKAEIGLVLMAALLVWDFSELFGVGRRKGMWLAMKVGLAIIGEYVIIALVFGSIIGVKLLCR